MVVPQYGSISAHQLKGRIWRSRGWERYRQCIRWYSLDILTSESTLRMFLYDSYITDIVIGAVRK